MLNEPQIIEAFVQALRKEIAKIQQSHLEPLETKKLTIRRNGKDVTDYKRRRLGKISPAWKLSWENIALRVNLNVQDISKRSASIGQYGANMVEFMQVHGSRDSLDLFVRCCGPCRRLHFG